METKTKTVPIASKICYTIAILGIAFALLLMLYPSFADAWNRYVAGHQIAEYLHEVEDIPDTEAEEALELAKEYNEALFNSGRNHIAEYTEQTSGYTKEAQLEGEIVNHNEEYESLLSFSNDGIMGYVSIPKIDVQLPIRHYTSKEVLASGTGHLYGSSLPVGGENTHSVITGHSALSTARLFTDLSKLKVGDTFSVTVAKKTLNYEVDEINVVLPDELDKLNIEEGKDLVTLITCTPYGVNTHRLLVRGHRIADDEVVAEGTKTVEEQALSIWHSYKFMISLVVLILVLTLIMLIKTWKKPKQKKLRGKIYDSENPSD